MSFYELKQHSLVFHYFLDIHPGTITSLCAFQLHPSGSKYSVVRRSQQLVSPISTSIITLSTQNAPGRAGGVGIAFLAREKLGNPTEATSNQDQHSRPGNKSIG
jgi:hypothetical protein